MASGDSFLKTLTIEGECDRSCNLRKFREPLVYVRLPADFTARTFGKAAGPANLRPRGQSLPPNMGRRRMSESPLGRPVSFSKDKSYSRSASPGQVESLFVQLLSRLWLPICFTGINAVCYAIEPATGALMMTSSAFLLHQMGVAGRWLTASITVLTLATLLLHGSDVVYIMVVHTLYYCAVSMGNLNKAKSLRIRRPYVKKSG